MKILTSIFLKRPERSFLRRLTTKATEGQQFFESEVPSKKVPKSKTNLDRYFDGIFYLKDIKQGIPEKHFVITRKQVLQHMYLIDEKVGKDVTRKILPYLKRHNSHIVCETNPGLGLITTELLKGGVDIVRLYESCPEFRQTLKNLSKLFPERIELFTKDIYHIGTLSYADRYDSGNRVKEMLKGIPVRPWNQDPAMTIIGPMPHRNFLRYLTRMIVLQQEIITYGRIQIFALMEPIDFEALEATPNFRSRAYKYNTVLFQLFFSAKLLSKYNRKSFLPWKSKKYSDDDLIYLVKIVTKETLPIPTENLLYFYYFIKESFRKQKQRVVPLMENWLPGIGATLILSNQQYDFKNISIYTEFKELHPKQLIFIFRLMLDHPEFKSSPFIALMDAQLLKDETVETDSIVANEKLDEDEDNLEGIAE